MARDSKTTSSEGNEPSEMEDVSVSAPTNRVWGSNPDEDATIDATGEKKKREKLTGAELEARWEAGAGARSAAFKRATTPGRLRAVAAGALIIGALVGGVVMNANQSTFETKRVANIATIKEIQGKIDAIGQSAAAQPDGEKVKKYVEEAQKLGASVATTQNEYLKLGSGPEDQIKLKEVAKTMDGYLSDGRAKNARVPWASRTSNSNPQTDPFGWRFVSANPRVDGKTSDIDVMWTLNMSKSGELVSWALGVYDGTTGKITKVTWGTTKKGVSLVPNSVSNDDSPEAAQDEHDHGPEATAGPSSSASPSASPSTSSSATPSASASPSTAG